jgi:hypothetical protein
MEVDLDLGDELRARDNEYSGDQLIDKQYCSHHDKHRRWTSSMSNVKRRISRDSVLHRPTTPSQIRQSTTNRLHGHFTRKSSYSSQTDDSISNVNEKLPSIVNHHRTFNNERSLTLPFKITDEPVQSHSNRSTYSTVTLPSPSSSIVTSAQTHVNRHDKTT